MAIKAIIFDCFGVFVLKGDNLLYRDYPQFSKEITELFYQCDLGFSSRHQLNEGIANLTGLTPHEVEYNYWRTNEYNLPLVDLVKELKTKNYKIGMLSNINGKWMESILPLFEREKLFDDTVLSSEVQMVKPDPAIFQLAAKRLGCEPNECIMIDDKSDNITSAKSIGMLGIVYTSNDQLESELQSMLEHS